MSFFNDLRQKNWFIAAVVVIVLLFIAGGAWWAYYLFYGRVLPDAALKKAFLNISAIQSYSQYIETQDQLSGRTLKIVGVYNVDTPDKSFAAYSTTTLIIPGDPKSHTFNYQNIALGNGVYTRVQTTDALLQKTIQTSTDWLHFTSDAIPASLVDIVVPGPVQDNLRVLSDNGAYLLLVKKWGPQPWGTESLLRYTFKLSGHTSPQDGVLGAILSRVGPNGTVDLWIDPATDEPRYLRFESDPYISTTTLEDINTLPPITAPATQS